MLVHGGKMEIESQLGRGTKVSLFFPTQKNKVQPFDAYFLSFTANK